MRYRYDIFKGIQKVKTKTTISIRTALLSICGLGIAVALPVIAHAANGNGPTPNWHIGYYNSSGRALSFAQAEKSSSGLASLSFSNQPNTALLVTDQGTQKSNLLGDLTGKTLTANFTITGATGAFTYYGEGTSDNPCETPASARLFFETSNAGGFDYTHYWWSNPASQVLASGPGTVTATVDPAEWSDWNGQFGNTVPDGFAAAASNVTEIGLSFGGGCFFENGIGTTDGTGVLNLDSYTVSP